MHLSNSYLQTRCSDRNREDNASGRLKGEGLFPSPSVYHCFCQSAVVFSFRPEHLHFHFDFFDFVIGLDMIRVYKMELRHDPFRVTVISYSNLRGPSNASRTPRRVNLTICINSLKDDEGHDARHCLCDVQNFRAECVIQGFPEEEALVLIPDENNAFSYRQLLMQLTEMKDQVEADDIGTLLTKVVDVQLPERKDLVKDSKVATDDGLEDSFRARVISVFPSLCADSLPHDGPAARQLDGSPFRVKLRLKEGIEPQGRRPYRCESAVLNHFAI